MLYFHNENTVLLKNKRQVILPLNMLASLAIHNSFVSDVYMDDISAMVCQIHHLHLKQYFIKNIYHQN